MKKTLLSIFAVCGMLTTNAQTYEWTKQITGTSTSIERGFSVSTNGTDVYTVGYFNGTMDAEPGSGITNLATNGSYDVFIQKLDANGNFLWAKSIGGTGVDLGRVVNNYGTHVIVSGTFNGTVDFDPNGGVQSRTSNGGADVFVLALDGSGNFLWVNTFGGASNETIGGQEIDNLNYIVVTGGFIDAMSVPLGGGGTSNLTATGGASTDVYVAKMVLNTGWINWAKSFGGTSIDYGVDLTIKANKNIVLVGSFRNTIDADPGSGSFSLSAQNNADAFIVELDDFGVFVDAHSFRNLDNIEAYEVTLDVNENIYVSGAFKLTTDFDPKVGVTNITSNGDQDCFVVKLNSAKDLVWAKTFGGSGLDQAFGMRVAPNGDVYVGGLFSGTVDFDPGAGTVNRTAVGQDIFINKLNASGDFQMVYAIGGNFHDALRSLDIDANGDMYVAGYFEGNAYFGPTAGSNNLISSGLADPFLSKYSNLCTSQSIDVQTACNSYTWIDGNTYISSNNTATHTLTNASNCDSVVTLDLTINSNTGMDVQTACNSYVWIDGNTYISSNNTATHTLTNALNCDSVVTLDLTINTVGVNTTLSGTTITANNASATSYQWINCSNNAIISGATNASYTATSNGDYAVIITEGSCSDTSSCETILTVGINDLEQNKVVNIYPNPVQNQLFIELNNEAITKLDIIDFSGKLILSKTDYTKKSVDVSDLPKGIYAIQITTEEGVSSSRFIKQ